MEISRKYKAGKNRSDVMLLPPSVEDYVSPNNAVRAIEAYVNTLNLQELGFTNTLPQTGSGHPAYAPQMLLKLYLYGYTNRLHSSRRLEIETKRNLEVMWLVESLCPGYKTIADFRKDNSRALKLANKDFVLLCKSLGLLGGEECAVDGSFFKGNTSAANIYTKKNLGKVIAAVEKRIEEYQQRIDAQDTAEEKSGLHYSLEDNKLADKIAKLKQRQAEKLALQKKLEATSDTQISTVDPDARLLKKSGKVVAGYNVQIAVDGKHKLIVASEVTQDGNDSQQLMPMLKKAQETLQSANLKGLVDSGYNNSEQLKEAEDEGIEIYLPLPKPTEAAAAEGRFIRAQFKYDAAENCYGCPQGETLRPREHSKARNGRMVRVYSIAIATCANCPLRTKCLSEKSDHREIERWEHEAVIDRHKARMKDGGEFIKKRSQIVEHPFGTMKCRAGMHHFLMRGMAKCKGEFSLMTLSYNLTRVLNIIGLDAFRNYCAQRSGKTLKMA
ncbi:MAG: IS1182 family transposase [Gallionellaceae bacterium]